MTLQAQKELEQKMHHQLYNNIYLLTLSHSPSEMFNSVFKKDMFVKNNKAAFHQVIYYLLTVLDPVKIKEKVTNWPIFEVKMEAQFRSEVMRYLNDIRSTYNDLDIPLITPSHFISPGGFKFVKFMLKLSQFVLLEHLKRDFKASESLILPIRPSKDPAVTKERIKNMNFITETINQHSDEKMKNFKQTLDAAKEEADKIINNIKEADRTILELKAKYELIKEDKKVDLPNFHLEQGFCKEINEIKGKMTSIEDIVNRYKKCTELAVYLNDEDIVLDYNKENFIIPTEMQHSSSKTDVLVFKDVLNAFMQHIRQKQLTFQALNEHQIKDISDNCKCLLERINSVHINLNALYVKLIALSEQVNETFPVQEPRNVMGTVSRKPFRYLQYDQLTEEEEEGDMCLREPVLAVPLEVSSENKENLLH